MNHKKIAMMALALGAILFIAGCANGGSGNYGTGAATAVPAASLSGDTKEFDVKTFQFGFNPLVMEVNKGDLVRINAVSMDVPHGFAISGYNVNIYVTRGAPSTTEFVASKTGNFPIYCTVPCGSGHGAMQAMLVVNG